MSDYGHYSEILFPNRIKNPIKKLYLNYCYKQLFYIKLICILFTTIKQEC